MRAVLYLLLTVALLAILYGLSIWQCNRIFGG
jgi:cytochrome oxidase assembly protein ShyY1